LKAAPFAYVKARTLEEAFELLEKHGEGARILAGGQSLIPSLNMRLSSPELLIDITGLTQLSKISLESGVLSIGALVTHAQIEKSEEIRKHAPLLAEAVVHVAHPAIRNRGTFGGSLALADPAAEAWRSSLPLNWAWPAALPLPLRLASWLVTETSEPRYVLTALRTSSRLIMAKSLPAGRVAAWVSK